jgi:hypothetical protein
MTPYYAILNKSILRLVATHHELSVEELLNRLEL